MSLGRGRTCACGGAPIHVLAAGAAGRFALLAPAAHAAVPPATLTTVAVPGTTALGASPDDLSAYGYVEEEYYVTGTANRYRIVDPLATRSSSTAAIRTRRA